MKRSRAPSNRGEPSKRVPFRSPVIQPTPFRSPLTNGGPVIRRVSVLPCLSVPKHSSNAVPALKRAFKSPCPPGTRTHNDDILLRRKSLGALPRGNLTSLGRGTARAFRVPCPIPEGDQDGDAEALSDKATVNPGFTPLTLLSDEATGAPVVQVPPLLCQYLRPHQREGVQFVFNCVTGRAGFDGRGCILADDMGLGKTLQSITLLYTLTKNWGQPEVPWVKKAIVVCPTSLVKNWDKEVSKWLGERVRVIALAETSKHDVALGIRSFVGAKVQDGGKSVVLVISYDTFRLHASRFTRGSETVAYQVNEQGDPITVEGIVGCDLLICDEAHRLKNNATLTNIALAQLCCRRRILLSGTPIQNDLQEFYSMVEFTNPSILGSPSQFRKQFENPILRAREPDAIESDVTKGAEKNVELSSLVNKFILRRTNDLLSAHLPTKVIQLVYCAPTKIQRDVYRHFLKSKEMRYLLNGKHSRVLSSITSLKKLCNHPQLIHNAIQDAQRKWRESGGVGSMDDATHGFSSCAHFFDDELFGNGGAAAAAGKFSRRGGRSKPTLRPELSGKFEVLYRLLKLLRTTTGSRPNAKDCDRIVIVSNYTQTLDLLDQLCRSHGWPCIRLDGSTTAKKRQSLVDKFNDPLKDEFVFLLSSKAGGCGLNLVGGNRLVLFDPDWNPATDKQAAARVWRDGQTKKTFVYRFFTTGTIEEKIFQRQISKEGLQTLVVDEREESNCLSSKDLKQLFRLRDADQGGCDTYDKLSGGASSRSTGGARTDKRQDKSEGSDVQLSEGSAKRELEGSAGGDLIDCTEVDDGLSDTDVESGDDASGDSLQSLGRGGFETPANAKPCKTRHSRISPAAEKFKSLWPSLLKKGWKCVPGSGLVSYFYLVPGITKKKGILGYNMFGTQDEVLLYIENIENDSNAANETKEETTPPAVATKPKVVKEDKQPGARKSPLGPTEHKPQSAKSSEEDLMTWEHHFNVSSISHDPVLKQAGDGIVDFVFSYLVKTEKK